MISRGRQCPAAEEDREKLHCQLAAIGTPGAEVM
jgi:hypothetical protein